jgi:G:T-mismatch repair DNA endonuclease (very short patch repair protein)
MLEHVCPQTPALAIVASAMTPYWRRLAHNCHLDRPTLDVLCAEGWRVRILSRRGPLVRLDAQPGD